MKAHTTPQDPISEQTLYFAGNGISNSGSPQAKHQDSRSPLTTPAKRSLKLFMQTVSETGYLLFVYQCRLSLVKFFFFSAARFSLAGSLRPQIHDSLTHKAYRCRKALSGAAPCFDAF